VVEIRGSYTNVMGLPTQRLYPFLKNLIWPLRKNLIWAFPIFIT
jgi:predicted house-cleaning NTP pyrophosphatase (Maf/HAM1 superfamily)